MTFNLSLRSFAALFDFLAFRNEGTSVLTSSAIDSGIRSICHMIVILACLPEFRLARRTSRTRSQAWRNSQSISNKAEAGLSA